MNKTIQFDLLSMIDFLIRIRFEEELDAAIECTIRNNAIVPGLVKGKVN